MALTIAIVAAGIAAASMWYARSSAHAAGRSAVASEKSAGAAEKSAQAQVDLVGLEKEKELERHVLKGSEILKEEGKPPWEYVDSLLCSVDKKEEILRRVATASVLTRGQSFGKSFRDWRREQGRPLPEE